MKTALKDFIHDNADEMGMVSLAYVLSYVNFIAEFLDKNGWSPNDFLLGTLGQFIFICFAYLSGKKRGGVGYQRVGKNLVALFLGGMVAMMVLPFFPLENGGLLSTIGVVMGFTFQSVWKRFIVKYVDSWLGSDEKDE